ncbi:hypothetical protein AZ002_003690 [Citrobacter freundii]|nr:hypothetical protein CUC48_06445 [Citrobacter freundii]OUE61475.1 hypothetical protein AZ002_003690 [Citrobacter freundii]
MVQTVKKEKTKNIPHEGNEIYYAGLRSILSGTVYSMLGTYITALMTNKISLVDFIQFPLVLIHALPAVCLILWWSSYRRPNMVFWSVGPTIYFPKTAKIILVLMYILIGVMCSLIFDAMSNPYLTFDTLIYSYISLIAYWLLLVCFSSVSIKKFSEE